MLGLLPGGHWVLLLMENVLPFYRQWPFERSIFGVPSWGLVVTGPPPITAHDSRHNLGPGTALSREAAGRGCVRPLGRRRGGGACGRLAAGGEGVR